MRSTRYAGKVLLVRRILHLSVLAFMLSVLPHWANGQSNLKSSSRDKVSQSELKKKKAEKRLCSWYRANYRHIGGVPGDLRIVPSPEYPQEAKELGITGIVIVIVRVDEKGHVDLATACEGHALLKQAAVQAAYKAEFEPLTLNGNAVKRLTALTYTFNN